MTRKYIDCRDMPSASNCTIAISADSEQELEEAAVQHAMAVHQHSDSAQLRQQIRQTMQDGTPPLEHAAVAGPARQGAGGKVRGAGI